MGGGSEDENGPEIPLKYLNQPLGDSTHPRSCPKDKDLFPRNRKQRNLVAKWVSGALPALWPGQAGVDGP